MQRSLCRHARIVVLAFWVGCCLSSMTARAAAPDIAKRYCATCHEVTPGVHPRNRAAGAPSFLVIANDPVMGSADNLAHVISQNHASMPPFSMTASERQSLFAYIGSLNSRKTE